MICSFECTFCRICTANILENVCPNCGGGSSPRPIRPENDWKNGDYLSAHPASKKIRHRPLNATLHKEVAKYVRAIPPALR
jgi:uncharacterized protein